ncbi:NrsF family protein [Ralstonia sp. SET104]|uniref:NrsF family protein n=1 Tax=Ralstonia sp. SET104 TaxID=2448774 RepID=UPI000F56EF8D|nr:NrsF family protein [Ralstonia sp. SET104]GCB05276.1 hypothetical protein PSUB009319_29070 [Ralstonia sp. SET104]
MRTLDLIESLAADARPVRRLRPPVVRAASWLLLAMLVLALVALVHGVRPDLALKLRQPVFSVGVAAAALTGVLAAVATFVASIPGRSRRWLLLPAPALAVWVTTIGYGCLTDWVNIGPDGIWLGETARCFGTLVMVSVPLSGALLMMLRYVAWLSPAPVAMCGSLAIAALAAVALSILHPLDATALILLWNFGATLVLVGISGVCGQRLWDWLAPR